jgi:hypothetical protein
MTEDQIRIVEALLSTALDEHEAKIVEVTGSTLGHSALNENAGLRRDVECLHCGHINEAEYMLAEARA